MADINKLNTPSHPQRGIGMAKTAQDYEPSYALYGILNPHGQFWTHETFTSKADAPWYLKRFWKADMSQVKKFTVIPVRVRLSDATTPREE